jgi:hypothetical protein
MPAPMVATSATAILNDIALSNSLGSPSGREIQKTLQNGGLAPICPRIVNRVR